MSGMNYPVADRIVDVGDLLTWVGHARAEIAALRARAEAAEAVGFQRAIDAAVAIIDARHDEFAGEGTEFSPFHAGMVDALSWASDKVEELATKAKAEGTDR